MIFGVSHVILPARDLAAASHFYQQVLGFCFVREHEEGIDLDASSVTLRLVLRQGERNDRVVLRVQTGDVEAAVERLVAAGAAVIAPPSQSAEQTLTALLEDRDGHQLVLWRNLSEDEWDFVPELPTTRPWAQAADQRLRRLLARVPDTFRDLARRGSVAEAEHLSSPLEEVAEVTAVRAFIRATPRMMRPHLLEPLRSEGLDPDDFRTDFEC